MTSRGIWNVFIEILSQLPLILQTNSVLAWCGCENDLKRYMKRINWDFPTIATNLVVWLANLSLYTSPHNAARVNVSRNTFFFSNSSALAFSNGFFHGCTIANANMNAWPQNDYNSAWIFSVTEQSKLYFLWINVLCVTILVTLSQKKMFLTLILW